MVNKRRFLTFIFFIACSSMDVFKFSMFSLLEKTNLFLNYELKFYRTQV